MIRQTSIDAYLDAIDRGVVSQRRFEVLVAVCTFSNEKTGITANETWEKISNSTGKKLRHDSNTRARFTELREMGLLKELGTRKCNITGVKCIAWYPTFSTNVEKITKKNKIDLLLQKERERCALIAEKWSSFAAQEIRSLN